MCCRIFAASLLTAVVCARADAITVTNTADSGPGSLRQAIQNAADGDTITFSLPGNSTITLTSGELLIDKSLNIQGPGRTLLTVRRNTAAGTPRFRIFNIASGNTVTMSRLLIGNGDADFGGGILNNGGTLTIDHSAVVSNTAGAGAGIFCGSGSTSTITASTISNNVGGSGTGIESSFSALNIIDSTIAENAGLGGSGAGIANYGGPVAITNSTIFSNSTNVAGGGILNTTGGLAVITNVTVSGNVAGVGGGIVNSGDAITIVKNSIVARNGANDGIDISGAINSDGFNLIGNNFGATITPDLATDLIGVPPDSLIDPLLQELADNGGPTKTIALLPGSPAIDAGNDGVAPPRDQRNYVRQGVADIGAFEAGATIPVTLQNISTRGLVQTGNDLVIGGLIIAGGGPKAVVLRALGPTLGRPPFNVSTALANPVLELHDSVGALIISNDNWPSAPNAQAIIDSGLAPPDNLESSVLTTLAPGNYTAVVRGANNGTGIALFESYDLDFTAGSKFGNISTRGFVQTGGKIMIAGVIVRGPDSENAVIRGLGPTLGQPPFTVPNALQDPFLDLRDANGNQIITNDNWKTDQQAQIEASGLAPPDDLESAVLVTLAPGNYTALLRGVNNISGNALVEAYNLD